MAPETKNGSRDFRPQAEIDNHPNEWYRNFKPNFKIAEQSLHTRRPLRIIIIGAGASGLLAAYKAARNVQDVTYTVYEKNDDVGGCWYENRYPGLEIDSPSHTYQWTFHRNPAWSQYLAPGREVWSYLKNWAVESDLIKHVNLNHRIESAVWHEKDAKWEVTGRKPSGETFTDSGDILVSTSGALNNPKMLDVPGINNYKGRLIHSSSWPENLDLKGKTVAVIGGAGASGVQIVPAIQPDVGKLIVYLRSKFWAQPKQNSRFVGNTHQNFKYSEEQIEHFRKDPKLQADYQRDLENDITYLFESYHRGGKLHETFVRALQKGTEQNFGKERAKQFTPDYGFGCRRSLPAPGYAAALQSKNVDLVQASVVGFTETGIIDSNGGTKDAEIVISATSFEAFGPAYAVTGRGGRDLGRQIWSTGRSYLSIMNEGFPNHFYLPSTNTPANHGSFLPMIEAYMHYIFQVITHVQRTSIRTFVPKAAAVEDFFVWTHELMKRESVAYPCHSWFKNGTQHGPVLAVYAGSRSHFYEVMKTPRYEDFDVDYLGNRFTYFGNGVTNAEVADGGDPVWYLKDLEEAAKGGLGAYDPYQVRKMGKPANEDIVIPKLKAKESKL